MEDKTIIHALRALSSNTQGRSKTSIIRTYYDEIEQAKKKGVKLEAIVDTLNQHGIDIQINTLRMILSKLRKEKQTTLVDQKVESSPKSLTPSDLRKIRNQPIELEE